MNVACKSVNVGAMASTSRFPSTFGFDQLLRQVLLW
jgi:hypothetical protein